MCTVRCFGTWRSWQELMMARLRNEWSQFCRGEGIWLLSWEPVSCPMHYGRPSRNTYKQIIFLVKAHPCINYNVLWNLCAPRTEDSQECHTKNTLVWNHIVRWTPGKYALAHPFSNCCETRLNSPHLNIYLRITNKLKMNADKSAVTVFSSHQSRRPDLWRSTF